MHSICFFAVLHLPFFQRLFSCKLVDILHFFPFLSFGDMVEDRGHMVMMEGMCAGFGDMEDRRHMVRMEGMCAGFGDMVEDRRLMVRMEGMCAGFGDMVEDRRLMVRMEGMCAGFTC